MKERKLNTARNNNEDLNSDVAKRGGFTARNSYNSLQNSSLISPQSLVSHDFELVLNDWSMTLSQSSLFNISNIDPKWIDCEAKGICLCM